MRITSLHLTQWMGYEQLDLDFEEAAYVVVGANGSGKSSLLDAITWALYGEARVRDADKMIHGTAKSCRVAVGFEAHGMRCLVGRERERGKTGSLALVVGGEERTRHTIPETEAAIRDLIGLSHAALMAGPIMVQEQAGSFMARRPADRKNLLAEIAELDRWTKATAVVHEERRSIKDRLAMILTERQVLNGTLAGRDEIEIEHERLQERLGLLQEAQSLASDRVSAAKEALVATEAQAPEYARARAQSDTLTLRIPQGQELLARATANIAASEAALATASAEGASGPTEAALTAARDALAQGLRDREAQGEWLVRYQAERHATAEMQRASKIAQEVPCGGQGKFARCQFLTDVPTEAAYKAQAAALAILRSQEPPSPDLVDLRDRAEAVQNSYVATMRARTQATSAEGRLADQRRQRDREQDLVAAAVAELDQLTARLVEMGDLEARRAEALNDLAGARGAYDQHHAALADVEREARENTRRLTLLEDATDRDVALAAEQKAKDGRGAVLAVLEEAFGRDGVPTMILEAMLPQIEERANEALDRMPGQFRVRLVTERALKGGGTADTLDVLVLVDGAERDYDLLSVGQRFRVDLGLRLGLAHVLASRTGSRVETLWLDEPLAALDPEGRDAVVDTLASLQGEFGLTVVVSHDTSFNDRFSARIEVEMDAGVSRAEVIA